MSRKSKGNLGVSPKVFDTIIFLFRKKRIKRDKNRGKTERKVTVDLGVSPGHILEELRMNNPEINIYPYKGERKMKDVTETIIRVIAEYLDKDPSEIQATDTFAEIGLDSLDIMELVMQLQEELDCKIELSQDITSIEKLAAYIEQQ